MPATVDLVMIGVNLLAGAGLLALLGVLTWVSWGVVRSGATTQHHVMRTARQRLVPALWAVLCVFVATSMYGAVESASLQLPNAWEVATAGGNRAYALLALGAYLFIVQIVLGLTVLSRGSTGVLAGGPRAGRGRDSGSDLGAALLSTLLLAAALFAVASMTAVGYVQLVGSTLK